MYAADYCAAHSGMLGHVVKASPARQGQRTVAATKDLSPSTRELRRLRVEFDHFRSESEQDTNDAEAIVTRLQNQLTEAVALYDLSRDENKRLEAENQRLRRILMAVLSQI